MEHASPSAAASEHETIQQGVRWRAASFFAFCFSKQQNVPKQANEAVTDMRSGDTQATGTRPLVTQTEKKMETQQPLVAMLHQPHRSLRNHTINSTTRARAALRFVLSFRLQSAARRANTASGDVTARRASTPRCVSSHARVGRSRGNAFWSLPQNRLQTRQKALERCRRGARAHTCTHKRRAGAGASLEPR